MATSGLGGFLYNEPVVSNGNVTFHWYDPEDASNTADATIASKDYPDGVTNSDARQVADAAYVQVSKQLNDKRDARIKKEASDLLNKQIDNDATRREAASEFLSNSKEISNTDSSLNVPNPDAPDSKKK